MICDRVMSNYLYDVEKGCEGECVGCTLECSERLCDENIIEIDPMYHSVIESTLKPITSDKTILVEYALINGKPYELSEIIEEIDLHDSRS